MDSKSKKSQRERERLLSELVQQCQSSAPERVDRSLRPRHHGVVANTPFALASAECIDLFRDGHFCGAISLSQAVGEALVRHMCISNRGSLPENFEENVRKLKQREFVDARIEVQLLQLLGAA